MASRRTDGSYGSGVELLAESWCVYTHDEPNQFEHLADFEEAVNRLREDKNAFSHATNSDPGVLARAVAYGHDLGRVVDTGELWTWVTSIDLELHSPKVDVDDLIFTVFWTPGIDSHADCLLKHYTYKLLTGSVSQTGSITLPRSG